MIDRSPAIENSRAKKLYIRINNSFMATVCDGKRNKKWHIIDIICGDYGSAIGKLKEQGYKIKFI